MRSSESSASIAGFATNLLTLWFLRMYDILAFADQTEDHFRAGFREKVHLSIKEIGQVTMESKM